MSERLRSLGLDVGTTSTQLILSELTIENRATGFSVPEMEIGERKILYRSPVYFTPLRQETLVDGPKIRELLLEEYRKAGITRADVDTGAIIITGETSRKENAREVLEALSDLAGDFVVATAGPDLESVLAAKGAGALELSEETGRPVLHMDIGGGTSNLCLIREGKVERTGCLNVGGRLVKLGHNGEVTCISPVLSGMFPGKLGNPIGKEALEALAQTLTQVLEMAAGLREPTDLLAQFATQEAAQVWRPAEPGCILSFSGGVADCIREEQPWLAYGDLGPLLGRAIRDSDLCGGDYVLGRETIRATVIGAGCHSAQLSGSTVFHRNIPFPLKNLPVVPVSDLTTIRQCLAVQEGPAILALTGICAPSYREITVMAQTILSQSDGMLLICMEQDMAKALGQALALRSPGDRPILCIDRVKAGEGSYLDIAAPIGGAMPVVIKTLVCGT